MVSWDLIDAGDKSGIRVGNRLLRKLFAEGGGVHLDGRSRPFTPR